jgi:hypothetical protein
MKRIATILRFFAISPEFLVSVTGLALLNFWPNWFLWLGERIGQQAELLKYFGLLPAALVVYDSQIVKNILLPESDKRAVLQGWSRYWDLKCGGVVGLVYGIMFAMAGFSALLFDWRKPAAHYAALLITSVVGALTVSASFYLTHIKIEELFRQQRNEESKA